MPSFVNNGSTCNLEGAKYKCWDWKSSGLVTTREHDRLPGKHTLDLHLQGRSIQLYRVCFDRNLCSRDLSKSEQATATGTFQAVRAMSEIGHASLLLQSGEVSVCLPHSHLTSLKFSLCP